MVAIQVGGRRLPDRRVKPVADAALELRLEALGRPALPHKEVLQAGALAVLSKAVRFAENLGHALDHGHHLVPAHEGVQAHGKMRF